MTSPPPPQLPDRRAVKPRPAVGALVAALLCGTTARAEQVASSTGRYQPAQRSPSEATAQPDHFFLSARSETQLRLFQRALLPGPDGALITADTQLPILERIDVRAREVDTALGVDATDVEVSAWGMAAAGEVGPERRVDGDVVTAKVTQRLGPAEVSLGRQLTAGGAARWSRFDGLSVGARSASGVGGVAYAGLTVLPRWDARPGTLHLGRGDPALVRDPTAAPRPSRSGYWLAGARAHVADPALGEIGLSVHEQRDAGELGRRTAGLDLQGEPMDRVQLVAQSLLDLGSAALADGRLALSFSPREGVALDVELLHTNPALFLSRQSVLSVFGSEPFDEAGSALSVGLSREIRLSCSIFVQRFGGGAGGNRGEVRLTAKPLGGDRLLAQLSAQRLNGIDNGYHALRSSLRYSFTRELWTTGEHYVYLYDEPIRDVGFSSVEALSLGWQALPLLDVLLGTSLSATPYAASDAQAMLRLRYSVQGDVRSVP